MFYLSCAVLTVFVAVFVLRPLFQMSAHSFNDKFMPETERDRLVDRKMVIYGNLKDLAFEYEMGRLSDEDFRYLEADYKSDAAVILQKLERLGESGRSGESEPAKNEPQCPSCGAELIPGKKFCANCGMKQSAVGSQQSAVRCDNGDD